MAEEEKVPLTRSAFERVKGRLTFLEGEDRQRIINDIALARQHGDLSENAEYHAAKEEQGQKEAEIRKLRQMLENAQIIEGDDDGVVKPGKLVTIREPGEGPETYLLGLREEKGGDYDVLTPDSPIGRVLLGHRAGETVVAEVPAGPVNVEIVEVRSI